jgi:periplasmic divalent cation tolerance protein
MSAPEVFEVIVTASDVNWLTEFTRKLVEDELAASGNIVTDVRSIYRWQGEIRDHAEAMVLLHTTRPEPIIERVRAEHGYELPGIRVATLQTTPEYAEWVMESTRRARR